MSAARPSFPRPSGLELARALAEIALVVVIGLGLSGAVLGRVLPALGHPVFVIGGPSMEPTIHVGSAVVLDRVSPGDLAVGDVVTLRPGTARAVFTHRIARLVERADGPWIETKGDNNPGADPAITPATAVLGRVSVVLPAAGFLIMLLSIPAGVVLVLSLGATIMVLGWYLDGVHEPAPRRVERADRPRRRPELRAATSTFIRQPVALGAVGPIVGGTWAIGLATAMPPAAAGRPVMRSLVAALPAMPRPRRSAPGAAPGPASPARVTSVVHGATAPTRLALVMPASAAGRAVLRSLSIGGPSTASTAVTVTVPPSAIAASPEAVPTAIDTTPADPAPPSKPRKTPARPRTRRRPAEATS